MEVETLKMIRLVKINSQVIVARRSSSVPEIREWFETETGDEFFEGQILQLDERADGNVQAGLVWADVVAGKDFDLADLPMFL